VFGQQARHALVEHARVVAGGDVVEDVGQDLVLGHPLRDDTLDLVADRVKNRFARPTPYTVETNATAMPAPSLDGSDRFSITWIRPSTAPRMPTVGA
jgi:hypothetical protein